MSLTVLNHRFLALSVDVAVGSLQMFVAKVEPDQ